MGQIIFPDTLSFSTGVFNNLEKFGKALRTKSVLSHYHTDWDLHDFGDRTVGTDTKKRLYIPISSEESFRFPKSNDVYSKNGMFLAFSLEDGGRFTFNVFTWGSQNHALFSIERTGNSLTFTDFNADINGQYEDDQVIYVLAFYCEPDYTTQDTYIQVSSKNVFGRMHTKYDYRYWKPTFSSAKIYDFLGILTVPSSPKTKLFFDYHYLKQNAYWLSPIIDMGPYIDITGVGVNESTVPSDMQMKIYTRVSSVAPSGEPTSFQDTAGNTLQYYPHDDSWSATDWEEVANGGTPNVLDRFIQVKVSFEVV